MTAARIGFWVGLAGMAATLALPAPFGLPDPAWPAAGLCWLMAAWWITEALPLSATALLPFIVLPLTGVSSAGETASAYYSPIIFLFIGGAFLALAVERTGLHRRLALAILKAAGDTSWHLLLAVMAATAILSALISNTSTALIMTPMVLAMLAAGGVKPGETGGMAGALPLGIAFAANMGGLATLTGTPTNAIAAGLAKETLDLKITFALWAAYGVPITVIGVPLAAFLIARVQRIGDDRFDPAAARAAIGKSEAWTAPERRLVPVVLVTFLAWLGSPLIAPFLPPGSLTDGTIAVIAGLALFLIPDGTGRPLLIWQEGERAPWGVILMFGGGLAMAMGMTESGLADWLGAQLYPLSALPLVVLVVVVVALVMLITEFASNVATASGIVPVVAALVVSIGVDPLLLLLPAAIASTWGFMLPAGTGPNAIAWSTGHVSLQRMVRAGILLDICGVALIVGVAWIVTGLVS
jgi:solute carrier family 13 (sodium-dependent dicarboxylate transporter), member 2/3/5